MFLIGLSKYILNDRENQIHKSPIRQARQYLHRQQQGNGMAQQTGGGQVQRSVCGHFITECRSHAGRVPPSGEASVRPPADQVHPLLGPGSFWLSANILWRNECGFFRYNSYISYAMDIISIPFGHTCIPSAVKKLFRNHRSQWWLSMITIKVLYLNTRYIISEENALLVENPENTWSVISRIDVFTGPPPPSSSTAL